MRGNIAAQQIREYPLCQGMIRKVGSYHMDIVSSNSPQDNPEYERAVRRLNTVIQGVCVKCGEHPIYSKSDISWCKVCHNKYARENARKNYTPAKGRERNLLRNYGITSEQYYLMVHKQGRACAICGQVPQKALVVDHCHISGAVRQLLCNRCNVLLGHAQDDPELLKSAINYLKKHNKKLNSPNM